MDSHQASIYAAVLIVSVVVGLILAYFLVSLIRQQRRYQQLHKARILAEVTTLERERARIASDLHDEIGPLLLAARYKLNGLDPQSAEDELIMKGINDHLDGILQRMREISNDLLPESLLRKGLVVAIGESVRRISGTDNLTIQFTFGVVRDLPQEKSIHLYRIVQELIQNTLKHARSTLLELDLREIRGKLVLEARDNGQGFDQRSRQAELKGMGLRNLLTRTEILGGHMYLDTFPGRGTHYLFEWPL
ncbi:MAG TPA: ATP-binding protein [Chitinophagaceae bacterium]|nr:ATP-binding protein [Chitinophagaceae bacterium]